MKTLTGRQRFFQMLKQFTMLNKVQDPLACNIKASLTQLQFFPLHLKVVIVHKGDFAQ
jgi:hypothetical protein